MYDQLIFLQRRVNFMALILCIYYISYHIFPSQKSIETQENKTIILFGILIHCHFYPECILGKVKDCHDQMSLDDVSAHHSLPSIYVILYLFFCARLFRYIVVACPSTGVHVWVFATHRERIFGEFLWQFTGRRRSFKVF